MVTAAKKARTRARIKSALIRAGRTFAQAFLASFGVALSAGDFHADTLEKTLVAAGIAGGAAVISLLMRCLDYSPLPSPPTG